jgi:tRNA pseudouridine32 synthase/23S rRNA pseudouridine746 synthase
MVHSPPANASSTNTLPTNTSRQTPPITIIHNHTDWLIINKPNGVSMQHEQGDISTLSLQQLALAEIKKIDPSILRLWPVHRLDKATSGLVIFAKSAAAAATFGQLFSQHKVKKHYLAIALGKPKKKQGWIKGDMEKGRNGSWLLTRNHLNPASTYFESSALETDQKSAKRLYLIQPKTGKTHQIRVALKSLGCAILGDERYKGAEADRCYLHAFALSFHWQDTVKNFQCQPLQGEWPNLKQIELLSAFYP